eukprot:1143287-Pelagomonas_calceolata.AAC.1
MAEGVAHREGISAYPKDLVAGFFHKVNSSYNNLTFSSWHDTCLGIGRLEVKSDILAKGSSSR